MPDDTRIYTHNEARVCPECGEYLASDTDEVAGKPPEHVCREWAAFYVPVPATASEETTPLVLDEHRRLHRLVGYWRKRAEAAEPKALAVERLEEMRAWADEDDSPYDYERLGARYAYMVVGMETAEPESGGTQGEWVVNVGVHYDKVEHGQPPSFDVTSKQWSTFPAAVEAAWRAWKKEQV